MTTPIEPSLPIEVLLVEDDPGDVLMTQEAFEEHKVRNSLNVVSDGVEALAYLRREGEHADAPRPDLILLDLNLPRVDGREVLQVIKNDEDLRRIPVVVLTTSQADEDILRSYSLHANAYVTKPVDFERFIAVVRQIDEFFVSAVKLPPKAYGLRADSFSNSSASATHARSNSPQCRLSFGPCALPCGSSTPVTRIDAFGKSSWNVAMNGIEPPMPMSTGSAPHASVNAERAASYA